MRGCNVGRNGQLQKSFQGCQESNLSNTVRFLMTQGKLVPRLSRSPKGPGVNPNHLPGATDSLHKHESHMCVTSSSVCHTTKKTIPYGFLVKTACSCSCWRAVLEEQWWKRDSEQTNPGKKKFFKHEDTSAVGLLLRLCQRKLQGLRAFDSRAV